MEKRGKLAPPSVEERRIPPGPATPETREFLLRGAGDESVGSVVLKNAGGGVWLVGYEIGEPHRGKGYASESLPVCLAKVLLEGEGVEVRASASFSNGPSIRVLEKVGFVPVPPAPEHEITGECPPGGVAGEWVLTREDFARLHGGVCPTLAERPLERPRPCPDPLRKSEGRERP